MQGFSTCEIAGLGPLLLPDVRCDRSQRPWWEAARLHSMRHFLGPGDQLLDIGTEMGDMSALFASWGLGMYLVEPNPKAWPWIASTFDANLLTQRVHGWYVGLLGAPEQAAVSKLDAAVFVGDIGWPDCANDGLDPATGFFHLSEHIPVSPVLTVDQLVETTGFRPTAITMDVEGGEVNVLYGAEKTLAEHRPKVWVSEHNEFMKAYGYTPNTLHTFMECAGYDRVFLATDHETHAMYLPKEYGWRY